MLTSLFYGACYQPIALLLNGIMIYLDLQKSGNLYSIFHAVALST
ncbi:hypothetical protein PTUN_b0093 [Pseudoalteromonas tunicata]|uniref:Uncharacterized protein n=1 Tax=Pseudoalteromonas tunicata D2 TaxID=87626 RepID=A4C3N5_9GAMM|nr:hypothetical protein PTUN_b0093 [Pseudoalteromonas tunicata]EAR30167.1 hypothetical protein PTD2_01321 [Pseudoalteromonas tunicata D2]